MRRRRLRLSGQLSPPSRSVPRPSVPPTDVVPLPHRQLALARRPLDPQQQRSVPSYYLAAIGKPSPRCLLPSRPRTGRPLQSTFCSEARPVGALSLASLAAGGRRRQIKAAGMETALLCYIGERSEQGGKGDEGALLRRGGDDDPTASFRSGRHDADAPATSSLLPYPDSALARPPGRRRLGPPPVDARQPDQRAPLAPRRRRRRRRPGRLCRCVLPTSLSRCPLSGPRRR